MSIVTVAAHAVAFVMSCRLLAFCACLLFTLHRYYTPTNPHSLPRSHVGPAHFEKGGRKTSVAFFFIHLQQLVSLLSHCTLLRPDDAQVRERPTDRHGGWSCRPVNHDAHSAQIIHALKDNHILLHLGHVEFTEFTPFSVDEQASYGSTVTGPTK